MSEISSDLVFHFTGSIDTVMSIILESGFRPGVAVEDIAFMLPGHEDKMIDSKKVTKVGIPMVCFTDIPLELSSAHREKYGCYGLGLSKDWAIRKGLNPVSYVVPNSDFMDAFNHLQFVITEDARRRLENGIDDNRDYILTDAVMNVAGYMKVYGEEELRQNFYDEREWRYLPPFRDNPRSQYCNRLMRADIDDEEKKRGLAAKMAKLYMLEFSVDDDLKKIIVPTEEDMSKIQRELYSLKCRDPEALIQKIQQV